MPRGGDKHRGIQGIVTGLPGFPVWHFQRVRMEIADQDQYAYPVLHSRLALPVGPG
jgi:hypothetical protein